MEHWKQVGLATEISPILAEVDVLVCGGGPAGVAAAVMSARSGLKTMLVEKNGYCGGAATAGLSGTICGLYLTQDNIEGKEPKQIVHGFAEEFRARLTSKNGATDPQVYGNTHVVTFDPFVWREVADDLLELITLVLRYPLLSRSKEANLLDVTQHGVDGMFEQLGPTLLRELTGRRR